MAKDDFQKLIDKKVKTTEDVGRILLFELVERKRPDEDYISKISYEELDILIHEVLNHSEPGDGNNGANTFDYYRSAYTIFLQLPDTVELYRTQALTSLIQARDAALACEAAENQRLIDRNAPVVLTAKQYKEVKKQATALKKKKLSVHDIFLDILDYLVEHHDLPRYKIPLKVEADKIDAFEHGYWHERHYTKWRRKGLITRGQFVKPFQALQHRKYYFPKSAEIAEDFPGLVESILEYMEKKCGFKNSTSLFAKGARTKKASAEMPSISVATLLESPIAFLYRKYDILPKNVAIIVEPISEDTLTLEDGNYIPPTPYWVEKCYEHCSEKLQEYVPKVLRKAYEKLRLTYRWYAMFQICADTLKVPTLPKLLKPLGSEVDIAETYMMAGSRLYQFYYKRFMENEMSRATFEAIRNTFLRISIDALKPKEPIIKAFKEKMSPQIFASQFFNMFEELK